MDACTNFNSNLNFESLNSYSTANYLNDNLSANNFDIPNYASDSFVLPSSTDVTLATSIKNFNNLFNHTKIKLIFLLNQFLSTRIISQKVKIKNSFDRWTIMY